MNQLKKIFASLILLIFVSPSIYAQDRKILRTTLDNGLTVILEQDPSAPVVAFQMWVRVGSADEKEGEFGIAHVFEHMLFKGTKKRGLGQIAKEVEANGGNINAYTSYDTTVYYLALPSRNFQTGLDIISDAIQNSTFDPAELKKELEVVLEELRMNEDSPERKVYKTLLSTAYTAHPYKRAVIGFEDTVKGLTQERILEFFKRWYIPNNMTLVVAGDFKTNEALSLIKESFRDFKKAPDPHTERPIEPPQTTLKTIITAQPIKQAHLAIGFHIPGLSHEDTYSLDVTASILSEGATSRLYKRLKVDNELVTSVSAYAMTPKEPGLFMFTLTLDTDKTQRAVEEIMDELAKLSYEGPTSRELEKAKLSLESDFVYSRETMDGKARQLGYYETTAGDLGFEKKYIDGIKGVDSVKIKEAIKKYFHLENATLSAIVPEGEEKFFPSETLAGIMGAALEKAKTAYDKERESEKLAKIRFENGITLIVKEDHSNPTVAFYATFPGGLRFETKKNNGIGNFTASMFTRGTSSRDRQALSREVEDMAGGISGFSGRNSIGVSANFLSRYFDKGLELFADIVLNPSFPKDEMEKLKKDIVAAIKNEEDYLPGYTFKLLYRELFKKHPYGMPVSGAIETVNALGREEVVRHYERLFVPEKMVITIVGDISTDYAIEKTRMLFKDFKRLPQKTPPSLSPEAPPSGIITIGEHKQKEQVNIGMGFIGPTITSDDSYPMSVLTEVLSAQGGRLFVELRDKKSLAYAVSAFTRPGVETGTFGVYIGSSPEKKESSIEEIINELKRITAEKATEEELERAKGSLIGSYEMGLEEVTNQASDMTNNELLGLGYDHYKRYASLIEKVTIEDLLGVAKKYITLDRYVISVVGPEEKKEERR